MANDLNKSLLQRIRELGNLTRSEEKIAYLIESHYPLTAFETIASISQKASVGKATVGRFIKRLGYRNFADFMKCNQDEMISRLESPIERYSQKREHELDPDDDQLTLHVSHAINNLRETLQRIDREKLNQAAEIMSSGNGRLFVAGAATSQALADYFHLLASYLRKDVYLIDANIGTLAHRLADIKSDDILFAMTHQRFAKITIKISQWFAKRGAKIILLTDREVTPISGYAYIQLVSCSHAPLMFSSRCSSFLLLEVLIAMMTLKLDPQVKSRFQLFDEFFADFSTFESHQPIRTQNKK